MGQEQHNPGMRSPKMLKEFKNHWSEEELKEWHDYKIYNIVIKLPDPWWSEQKPN